MRVTPHIASVKIPFEISLPSGERFHRSVYSHIVHGEQACIVDAGVAGSAEAIKGLMAETCATCVPKALLLTHTHPDHIGSASTLHESLGVPVACPAKETAWIEDVEMHARDRPVPGFRLLVEGSVRVGIQVRDDFVVDLGGVTLKTIPAPGHSPGSTSYEVVEDDAIISGDAVPLLSEPPIYDDALASLESVRRLIRLAPGHLLPSWHEPLHGADVARHLQEGERAIIRFYQAVVAVLDADPAVDDERACARVLSSLGYATTATNLLTLRTFRAHRRALADWPEG